MSSYCTKMRLLAADAKVTSGVLIYLCLCLQKADNASMYACVSTLTLSVIFILFTMYHVLLPLDRPVQ